MDIKQTEAQGWTVTLLDAGSDKPAVKNKIMEMTGLESEEAAAIVDTPPQVIIRNVSETDALLLELELVCLGANVNTMCDNATQSLSDNVSTHTYSPSVTDATLQKTNHQKNSGKSVNLTWVLFTLLVISIYITSVVYNLPSNKNEISPKGSGMLSTTQSTGSKTTVTPATPATSQSCSHNWRGSIQAGFIICSKCNKVLSVNDVKAKGGVGLTSVEKAKIYWDLDNYLTARKSNGKYLYSEDEAFSIVEKDYDVTRDYLKNNIWNGHAYNDYVKYYVTAWKS